MVAHDSGLYPGPLIDRVKHSLRKSVIIRIHEEQIAELLVDHLFLFQTQHRSGHRIDIPDRPLEVYDDQSF